MCGVGPFGDSTPGRRAADVLAAFERSGVQGRATHRKRVHNPSGCARREGQAAAFRPLGIV